MIAETAILFVLTESLAIILFLKREALHLTSVPTFELWSLPIVLASGPLTASYWALVQIRKLLSNGSTAVNGHVWRMIQYYLLFILGIAYAMLAATLSVIISSLLR